MSFVNLFNNKSNLELLLEQSKCLLIHCSSTGVIYSANAAAISILKLNKNKCIGTSLLKHCQKNKFSLLKLFDSKRARISHIQETYSKKKKISTISWKKNIVATSEGKEEGDILLIGKDISEVENLKDKVYFYENILSKLPTNVYWKNENSVYLGCNERLAKIMNLPSREAIVGMTDFDFDWGEAAAKSFIAFDKKIMKTQKSCTTEDIFRESSGKTVTVLTTKTPLTNKEGKSVGVLAISVDITDRKKMEQDLHEAKLAAEAANQAKTQFIANMSHDIRTPMTGIVGMSQFLEEIAKTPEEKKFAHWVNVSGVQLLHLLNDILDVISFDTVNETTIKEESFEVRQFINELIELEMPTTTMKELAFYGEVDKDVPKYIVSDRIKLHRVLLNLIGNAIKFTEEGHIKLKVELVRKQEQKVTLRFCVEDTGLGIPAEAQKKVFERFFKVTASYQTQHKGHGLGLNIAKSYVNLLGGDIQLTSQEGKGTTFFFELTFKVGDKDNSQNMLPPHTEPHHPMKHSPLVLIVEDNDIARFIANRIVQASGCQTELADSGEKALELVQKTRFDLILADLGLPGISGLELMKQIRLREQTLHRKAVPIVGLSAHAGEAAQAECKQNGADLFLLKPLDATKMKQVIDNFLSAFVDDLVICQPAVPTTKEAIVPCSLGADLPTTEADLFKLEQFPTLDLEEALKIYGGNKTTLVNLLEMMFNTQLLNDKNEILTYYEKKDWEGVAKIAHKMKGGAVYCGLMKMKMAAQYLERYHLAGHTSALESLYLQLISVLDDTYVYLKSWLEKH